MSADVNRINSLKGLKGLSSLSLEERQRVQAGILERVPIIASLPSDTQDYMYDRVYRDDLFVSKFGKDAYDKLSTKDRDTYYESSIVNEAIQAYKDDDDFAKIQSMTTEGKIALLESGYMTDAEMAEERDRLQKGVESVGKDKTYNFLRGMAEASNMATTITAGTEDYAEELKGVAGDYSTATEEARKKSLDAFIAKDNERKVEQSAELSADLLQSWQTSINNGEISEQEINDQFEELVGSNSRYYQAFKDTDIFEHFTTTDKMQFMSRFMGVAQKFGMESAMSTLETEMQNYVSDNQSAWDWGKNTTKNILLKGVANLANKAMGVEALAYMNDEEGLANFLQGKDANGNELPLWNNPLFWQGVDQFNTFDSNEIKRARENGGISPYQNITRAGEELDFISWNTLNESAKQLGYLWSEALASKLMGGAGKVIGKATKNLGPTTQKVLGKIGAGLDVAQSTAGMAEAEGLGAFQETLQSANEVIDAQIDKEVQEQLKAQYDTKEFNDLVNNQISELKKHYSSPERGYKSEEALKQEATEMVMKNLSDKYRADAELRHSQDREVAERSAVSAFKAVTTIDAVREAATNMGLHKFIFNKGTRQALGDNGPRVDAMANADGTVSASISNWNKYVKPIVKNPTAEFIEEVSDNAINNFGQGFGMNEYMSYHDKKYNPEAYVEATSGILGNIMAGITNAKKTLTDESAYYEGFIGALGGGGNVYIRPGILSSEQRGQSFRTDAEGNRLSLVESINKYVMNPILNDISEALEKERGIQQEVEAVNRVLTQKGSSLQDIATMVGALHDVDAAVANGNMLEAADAKHEHAFSLIQTLHSLGNSEVGSQTELYNNAMNTIEGLANGDIEGEELDNLVMQFLGQPSNRTIANQPNGREIAVAKLQENAQELLDMQKAIEEVNSTLDRNPIGKQLNSYAREELAYLKVMGKNWKDRLDSIEESIGTKGTDAFNGDAEFGSRKSYDRKLKAKEETIKTIEDSLTAVDQDIAEQEEIVKESSKKDRKYTQTRLDSLKMKKKGLQERLEKAKVEYSKFEKLKDNFDEDGYSRTLSKDEILSLNPEQRAWMLDSKNLGDYSAEQQQIINEVKDDLVAKDPSLLQQIQDASELYKRTKDVNGVFAKIVNNPIEANTYYNEQQVARAKEVRSVYMQKGKQTIAKLFDGRTDEEAQAIARNLPVHAIDDYIKDHPEKADVLAGAKEVAQFREDATKVIDQLPLDDKGKLAARQTVKNATEGTSNKKDAIDVVESIIDSDLVSDSDKDLLNTLLDKMQELDYQRNATKVADRKAKKERQIAKEKAAAEAKRKQEEAEKKAKEEAEARKKEVAKDGSNLVSETMEDSGIAPDGSNVQETIEVDESKVGSEKELVSTEDVDLVEKVDSPTAEEQAKDNKNITSVQVTKADPTANPTPTALVGNYFYRYKGKALKDDKYQEKRKGAEENDPLNRFFNWIESAGIKLQEIIDNELAPIMKMNAKVQFMMVIPNENATHDDHMKDNIFEVVEYTPEVAKIHKDERGGVINANGKRWLIIGVVGPRAENKEQGAYLRNLKEKVIKRNRYKHSQANPTERFYVDPGYYTHIESIGAGWLVRKLDGDTEVKIRNIRELLEDPNRNPRGLALEDLKWGIQENGEFKTVGVSSRNRVHAPSDAESNSGNVFMLVESSNGDYVPVALKPVMYTELKEGALKTQIDNLLMELTSPDHTERHTAISKLVQLLHLRDNNILIGTKGKNTLSIVKGDVTLKTFNLDDPTFNRMEFLESVAALNPRVNVTLTALSSPTTLRMLDDAGVLTTDVAMLGTTNADFNVYNVGPDGKPIETTPIENTATKASDLRKVEATVHILGQVYRKKKDGWVDAVDKVVTDPRMLEQIRYNNLIQAGNLSPVLTKDGHDYYIINQDRNNPVAVKRAKNSNAITIASPEQAIALIDKMAREAAEKKAEEAMAKFTLDESSLEDVVDVTEGEEVMTQEDIYGQMFGEFKSEGEVVLEEEPTVAPIVTEDINTTGTKSLAELQANKNLSTLGDISGDPTYGAQLDAIIDDKIDSGEWTNVPDDMNQLASYFKSKGIATTGITDVASWLDMIRECK